MSVHADSISPGSLLPFTGAWGRIPAAAMRHGRREAYRDEQRPRLGRAASALRRPSRPLQPAGVGMGSCSSSPHWSSSCSSSPHWSSELTPQCGRCVRSALGSTSAPCDGPGFAGHLPVADRAPAGPAPLMGITQAECRSGCSGRAQPGTRLLQVLPVTRNSLAGCAGD